MNEMQEQPTHSAAKLEGESPSTKATTEPAAAKISPTPAVAATKFGKIIKDGLWTSNPALSQLLGLCPLLAVTTTAVNGLALGLATILVLALSNLAVSLSAPYIPQSVRLPIYVLIIASLVTCVELFIQAFSFALYTNLGIFLPLIVTNCIILGRAEAFAARNSPVAALVDGLAHGIGFASVLFALGVLREFLGTGQLFSDLSVLGVQNFAGLSIAGYDSFLLLVLPPGGFILLGIFIAMNNLMRERLARRAQPEIVAGAKRVRVSG